MRSRASPSGQEATNIPGHCSSRIHPMSDQASRHTLTPVSLCPGGLGNQRWDGGEGGEARSFLGMAQGHGSGSPGAVWCCWGPMQPLKAGWGFVRRPWYGLIFCQISGGLSHTERVQGQALCSSQRSKILKAHTKASSRRFHFIRVEKWVFKHRESFSQPWKQGSTSNAGTQWINNYYYTSYSGGPNARDAIAGRPGE